MSRYLADAINNLSEIKITVHNGVRSKVQFVRGAWDMATMGELGNSSVHFSTISTVAKDPHSKDYSISLTEVDEKSIMQTSAYRT